MMTTNILLLGGVVCDDVADHVEAVPATMCVGGSSDPRNQRMHETSGQVQTTKVTMLADDGGEVEVGCAPGAKVDANTSVGGRAATRVYMEVVTPWWMGWWSLFGLHVAELSCTKGEMKTEKSTSSTVGTPASGEAVAVSTCDAMAARYCTTCMAGCLGSR
ncbi:hypothetical protein H257_14610 [Aphanomyces astaci]|uniref:Uncharacterized protein n=1 Tax=Aphanomyces astaci TaxID=112090 RepID=W4FSG3_APHAT|nr:hypothetical protein H257_14610 [Aphanomyces astaci]ETV69784.1 hypothetical protein H257_14610 [Aphanomyces astaci]|eukprot:XP_009840798.1 hypothetical protein H257_14610 [Aphanomyces astaci]